MEESVSRIRHHLVIVRDQYLERLLDGRKRVECRLSAVERPPFRRVGRGDLLWLKLPSRPVVAVAAAGRTWFDTSSDGAALIQAVRRHEALIAPDDGFFDNAAGWARYASLIWIESVVAITPMPIHKSDQRGWVVLDGRPRPGMRVGGGVT